MATANNTIKTRIQLKSDTEENWKRSVLTTDHPLGLKVSGTSFVPLLGELIVFTADETHPFCRLKVGDGVTNVVSLPFIDAGTINGDEVEIAKFNTYNDFPSPGNSDKLYIDLSTNKIYHYTGTTGYIQLSNFEYTTTKSTIKNITYWGPGRAASATIENNILKITNGIAPQLLTENVMVVTDIQKEGTE